MSKYIKLEDAIRKYAEMIADEAYWEYGVGDGSPDEEDLDIAREYYSDLPTIEVMEYPQVEGITPTLVTPAVSEDCISKAYLEQEIENQIMVVNEEYWRGWNNALDKVVELIEDAPSVVPTTEQSSKVGECFSDIERKEYEELKKRFHDFIADMSGAKIEGAENETN